MRAIRGKNLQTLLRLEFDKGNEKWLITKLQGRCSWKVQTSKCHVLDHWFHLSHVCCCCHWACAFATSMLFFHHNHLSARIPHWRWCHWIHLIVRVRHSFLNISNIRDFPEIQTQAWVQELHSVHLWINYAGNIQFKIKSCFWLDIYLCRVQQLTMRGMLKLAH